MAGGQGAGGKLLRFAGWIDYSAASDAAGVVSSPSQLRAFCDLAATRADERLAYYYMALEAAVFAEAERGAGANAAPTDEETARAGQSTSTAVCASEAGAASAETSRLLSAEKQNVAGSGAVYDPSDESQ